MAKKRLKRPRDTKIIASWMVGDRSGASARLFVDDLASRLTNRVQITTDGLKAYLEAVEGAFGQDVDYAMLEKVYYITTEDVVTTVEATLGMVKSA